MKFSKIQIFPKLVIESMDVSDITLILYMHVQLMIVHVSLALIIQFASAELSLCRVEVAH